MTLLHVKYPKATIAGILAFVVLLGVFLSPHAPELPSLKISSKEAKSFGDVLGKDMEDPELISYIRKVKLEPPSTLPYNLDRPQVTDYSQFQQSTRLDKKLKRMRGGFFVEVGAQEGERISNTLFFEKERNWTGLLVEVDPVTYTVLKSKNRKSYIVNGCLSLTTQCTNATFPVFTIPKKVNDVGKGVNVQCYPLYSLMLAVGRNTIDLFSLDIEGHELKVLKTIPWDKLQVRILNVEMNHVDEGADALKEYMESVGYTLLEKHVIDFVFVKTSLLDTIQH